MKINKEITPNLMIITHADKQRNYTQPNDNHS